MPRKKFKFEGQHLQKVKHCPVCGRTTRAKDGICTRTAECMKEKRSRKTKKNPSKILPDEQIIGLLLGSTITKTQAAKQLHVSKERLTRVTADRAVYRCWKVPDSVIKYAGQRMLTTRELIKRHPQISINELINILQVRQQTVFSYLKRLKAQKIWMEV